MVLENLLLPHTRVVSGEYYRHTVGTHFFEPKQHREYPGGPLMDWRTGITASAILNDSDGTNVLVMSNANGRIQFANPATDGYTFSLNLTPSDRPALEPYVGKSLQFNLLATETANGLVVDVMRECFIVIQSAND